MRDVIRVPGIAKEADDGPVELICYYPNWLDVETPAKDFDFLVYLGRCRNDGDMFAGYLNGNIFIMKGHLNSGKY